MASPPRYKILHVDDDDLTLKIIQDSFTTLEPLFDVDSTTSTQEAVRLLGSSAYSCVIVDFSMPEMTGLDFAKLVIPSYRVPVILYTGKGSEDVAEKAFKSGVFDYVKKEVDPAHIFILINSVKRAIEQTSLTRLYKDITDNSIDGITIKHGNMIVYANPAFAELCGYSDPKEVVGLDADEFIAEEDQPRLREMALQRQSGVPQPPRFEFKLRNRYSATIPCESVTTLIKYKGQIASLSQIRDLSERKKSRSRLQISEDRYRSLFENLVNGLFVNSITYNEDGTVNEVTIININPFAEQMFGITTQNVKGKTPRDVFGKNSEITRVMYAFASNSAGVKEVEVDERIGDSRRSFHLHMYKVKGGGFVSIIEDVTSLKEQAVEREKLQRRALEQQSTLLTAARLILRNERFTESAKEIFESGKFLMKARDGYLALFPDPEKPVEIRYHDITNVKEINPNYLVELNGLFSKARSSGKTIIENSFDMGEGEYRFGNLLLSPLLYLGRPIGMFCLANKVGGFTDQDKVIAASFAELLSIAYINNQYIRELKDKQANLEEMNRLLNAERSRYESTLDTAQEGIAVFIKNRCVYTNSRNVEIFGARDKSDLIGRELFDFLDKGEHARAKTRMINAIQTGERQLPEEFVFRRLDGTAVPIESSGTRIRWYDDKPAMLYVWRDVSRRKAAEESRNVEANKIKLILDVTPCIMLEYDPRANAVKIEGNLAKLTGYEPSELGGDASRFIALVAPGDRERFIREHRRFLSSSDPYFESTYGVVSKSGEVRQINEHAVKLTDPDGGKRSLSLVIDVHSDEHAKGGETLIRYALKPVPPGQA